MILEETFILSKGVKIPKLGLGTWFIDDKSVVQAVKGGLIPLPKTSNPKHMRSNAEVDLVISDQDMESLRRMEKIEHYGEASKFPVYGRK